MDNRMTSPTVTPTDVGKLIHEGIAQLTLVSRKGLRKTRTVHDLRITTRKLRELLDAFEGVIDGNGSRPKQPTAPKLLKRFGHALSASRDQAVVKKLIRAKDQPRSVRRLSPRSTVAPKRARLKKLQRQLVSQTVALAPHAISPKECTRLWRLHVQRRANEVMAVSEPDTRRGMKREFYHRRRKAVRRLRISLELFAKPSATYTEWIPLCVDTQDAYGAYLDLCTALRSCEGSRRGIAHLKESRREALKVALHADRQLRSALQHEMAPPSTLQEALPGEIDFLCDEL